MSAVEEKGLASTTMAPIKPKSLLEIIKQENALRDPHAPKDKSTWKTFRDKLRLKRAGAAWTSSVRIPTSDIPVQNNRRTSRRHLVRYDTISSSTINPSELTRDHFDEPSVSSLVPSDQPPAPLGRPQFSRHCSTRYGLNTPAPSEPDDSSDSTQDLESVAPTRSYRPQMSRHNSTRFLSAHDNNFTDPTEPGHYRLSVATLGEERTLSAREAVAAQEAAEAEAAAAGSDEVGEDEGGDKEGISNRSTTAEPVKMSLMDLLEETDRQMGFEGSIYTMDTEDEDEEENEEEGEEVKRRVEYDCCVCMVRHGGAASTPCGHTFCRLCSKELRAGRGTCPRCNDFMLEILDVF